MQPKTQKSRQWVVYSFGQDRIGQDKMGELVQDEGPAVWGTFLSGVRYILGW